MATITVDGRMVGQRRPLVPPWEIPLRAGEEQLPLRDLIARVVREEVAAFQERQERRRSIQALTAAEIERAAATGKIDMGGREEEGAPVDPEQAVATALQAFADGLYYVFVDEQQQESLDRPVTLRPGSRVTFLRLVALAGG
jgi:hypothetical protein